MGEPELAAPELDVFLALDEGAPREEAVRLLAALRREGLAAEMDYAGRSLKGQLTQAQRLNAKATAVWKDGWVVRRRHRQDEQVDGSELLERLRA
jgi:histidyl-tRNA synthetase